MYQTIVIAFDGTEAGQAALEQGSALARLTKASLHILAIVVSSGGLLLDPSAVSQELLNTERQFLEAALEDCARALAKTGLHPITIIRDGDAAGEILAYLAQVKADLVVVGHSGKGLLERWFEGSIGKRLLADLPCSLLVAKASAAAI